MGPTGRLFDQRQAQSVVDDPQTAHTYPRAKLVEHPRIGSRLSRGQVRKLAPPPLFGQQSDQLIEGMGGREHRQQMEAPQLRGAQIPIRPTQRTPIPVSVDEIVWNVWVQESQQLRRAGHRQYGIHSAPDYHVKLYLSA